MDAWLAEGLKALVAGMGTVFVVLILIALIISLFEHLKDETEPKKVENKPNVLPQNEAIINNDSEEDDLELVAVITAAIAASLNTTCDKLIVKSFKRVNSNSRWNSR